MSGKAAGSKEQTRRDLKDTGELIRKKKRRERFAGLRIAAQVKPKVTGEGKGGRNSERCSACALRLEWGHMVHADKCRRSCPTKS